MPREYYADKFDTKKRVKLHVFVPPSMYEELETLFAEHGQTIQEGVVGMLRNELRNTSLGVEGSWGKVTPCVIDVPAGKARRFAAILARAQAREDAKYPTGETDDAEVTQTEVTAVAPTRPENRAAVLATAPSNQPPPRELEKPAKKKLTAWPLTSRLPPRFITESREADYENFSGWISGAWLPMSRDEFFLIRDEQIAKGRV
jgi:hypothetical protein